MCSTSLGYSFRENHRHPWIGSIDLPIEAESWLDERTTSFSLGGTLRRPTQDEQIRSYLAAAALLQDFQEAFPELAESFAIVREYNCHSECSIEQIYPTPASLLAEGELLAAGRSATRLPSEFSVSSPTFKRATRLKRRGV